MGPTREMVRKPPGQREALSPRTLPLGDHREAPEKPVLIPSMCPLHPPAARMEWPQSSLPHTGMREPDPGAEGLTLPHSQELEDISRRGGRQL